jgi:hypothetical protein
MSGFLGPPPLILGILSRGALKLYRCGDEPPVLHDLAKDPSEKLDLWGDNRYAEVGAELLRLLTYGWVRCLEPDLSVTL